MAESLGAAVLTVSVDDAQFRAGLNGAQSAAQRFGRSLQSLFSGGQSGQSLTGLSIKLNSLQQELQNVAIGSKRFRELRREIEQTQQALNRANGVAKGSGILGGLATGLAGLGIGAGVTSFLRGSVNAAIELETITKKLSNTLGPQGAGQALAFTRGLSDQLGLSFKTLATSFAGFTAAATAANVPLQEQQQLFAAVSRAAQALGLSNDEINGSLLALQQVASKGTVQMEELRGQLGERLPIAFSAAAIGLGITQEQLIKLVETGKLTSGQFFPALTKGLNELTKGAGGAPTAAQNFQKLGNAWDALQTSFGSNLLPTVTANVEQLTGALEGIGIAQEANKLGFSIGLLGNVFGVIPDNAISAVASLKLLSKEFNLTEQQARALFTDAVKLEGIANISFAKPDQLEAVLARLPGLAEEFRKKNQDTTGLLNAQNAEAAKAVRLAKLRSIEEQKTLDKQLRQDSSNLAVQGIQQRIQLARQLALAQGTSSVVLQNQFDIEDKLRAAQEARLQLTRELAKPGGDGTNGTRSSTRVDELLNASRQANLEVTLAYEQAGASLLKNAKSAGDALRSAQDSLQSTLRGGFQFLTQGMQQEQIARARASIQPLVDRGVIRSGIDISTPDRLFQVASFAESFKSAEQNLVKAQQENTSAIQALAQKDWSVQVSVTGNGSAAAYGDVLNGALAS